MTCSAIDAEVGAALYFKCENFQRIGAFKARGAMQRGVLARRRRGAPRRRHAFVGQSRRGARLRGAAARHSRVGGDAGQRAAGQAGQRPPLRRDASASARRSSPRARRRATTCSVRPARRSIHPFDDRARDRGAGHGGARAARASAGSRRRDRAVRRRRTAVGHVDRGHGARAGHRVFGAEPRNADDAAASFASGRVRAAAADVDDRGRLAHDARRRARSRRCART